MKATKRFTASKLINSLKLRCDSGCLTQLVERKRIVFMRPIVLFLAASLSGCTVSSTFVDRNTGVEYFGKTLGAAVSSEGRLQAEIEGERYIGSWVYMADGGSAVIGTGTVISSSGQSAAGAVSGMSMSAAGRGVVNLKGDKGSLLRCVYNWNEWSSSGIGECERSDGRRYDLRLKM
jgi:hypothetical protein